jgi:ketosteroid isomerase-like protein
MLGSCAHPENAAMMTTETQPTELDRILEVTHAWSRRFQEGGATFDPGSLASIFGAKGGCVVGQDAVRRLSANASVALGGHGATPAYEVLVSHVDGDLAYIAGIERVTRPGGPEMRLRITHVYQRIGGEWAMVHRHADEYRESPFEAVKS